MANKLFSYILQGKEFLRKSDKNEDFFLSTCDKSKYQSLWLRIGEYWFEVPPSAYVLNYKIPGYESYCTLGIISHYNDEVVLGSVFLYNFFTIYDLEKD